LARWRPITTFGLQMMSVSGVAMMTGKLSDLVLGRMLGVTALGLYGRASGLNDMIFSNLYGTVTRVVFVQLSKDYREDKDWRGTYLRSFAMITAVMWPALIGIAILAGPVIRLLYGERWLPAALPLSALMVAQFVGVAFGMNWELFVLRGETARQSRYEIIRLVFGIPIFAVGCLFNILTAALSKILDALIGLVVYYPHVGRLANLQKGRVPAIYRDSAILTVAAVLPSAIVMTFYRWSPLAPLPAVFGAVLLGMIFWLIVVVILRHPLRDELLVLSQQLRLARRAP
jgi:O-antigen/teichoic acid export membrane protein